MRLFHGKALLGRYTMNTLFPITPVFPEGFSYFPDFLSEDEEKQAIDAIAQTELHTLIFQGFEAK